MADLSLHLSHQYAVIHGIKSLFEVYENNHAVLFLNSDTRIYAQYASGERQLWTYSIGPHID